MTDDDPEISVTIEKGGRRRTVSISQGAGPLWLLIDSDAAHLKVFTDRSRAVAGREQFDARIRQLLEDGWTPV